jgi:orotate phosphoribosyltransferase
LSAFRDEVVAIVKKHGLEYREEPFRLASGELSHDYMDGKKALAEGDHLRLACEAIIELARGAGVEFDAVGGLTLGADAYATGIALLAHKRWFVVRKQAKDHGKGKRIEGAPLEAGMRVLLVDDVVSTGGSILEALEVVQETGAEIVLAVTLVDRGDEAEGKFEALGVPYRPLITYRDLEIKPVGKVRAATTG